MILGKFRREKRPITRPLVYDGDSRAPPPPPQWSPPRPCLLPLGAWETVTAGARET